MRETESGRDKIRRVLLRETDRQTDGEGEKKEDRSLLIGKWQSSLPTRLNHYSMQVPYKESNPNSVRPQEGPPGHHFLSTH